MTIPWPYPDDGFFANGYAEPVPARNPDDELANQVAQCLRRHAITRDQPITVTAQNGVVILLGEVRSTAASRMASICVWNVPGVVDVCNVLKVRRGAMR